MGKMKNDESESTEVEAWKDEEKEEEKFPTYHSIIQDYSEYSTIQGLIYIFFSYQTCFGKLFWILVIFSMSILGIYWCVKAYLDWQDSPVQTTIKTTAFPVKNIDFPAVTICGPGYNLDLFMAGFYKQIFAYFAANNKNVTMTPYQAAIAFSKVGTTSQKAALDKIVKDPLYTKFIAEKFPGLTVTDDIESTVTLLLSKNPDADVSSSIAFEGGMDPCNATAAAAGRRKRATVSYCETNFIFDSANQMCYQATPQIMTFSAAESYCINDISANFISVTSDSILVGLLSLLKSGQLVLPTGSNGYLSIYITDLGDPAQIFTNFPHLKNQSDLYNSDDGSLMPCAKLYYNSSAADHFELHGSDCSDVIGAICAGNYLGPPNCTNPKPFQTVKTLSYLLDPKLKGTRDMNVNIRRKSFKALYARLNMSSGFEALFSSLWYATLPCFDTRGVSAEKEGDKSLLRYCEWKGVAIPCGAIFTLFPTDMGMCCSFNIRAAEEIFKESKYTRLVKQLQKGDKGLAIAGSSLPKRYIDSKEPKTLPGKNKGLVLMLDAHSDLFTQGSVDSDYQGFTGLVAPSGSFPFMMQESFVIRPGHNNIISLTATNVNADDSLKDLSKTDRQCLFPDENDDMKIHNNYTYSNCIFECAILFAMEQVKIKYGLAKPCTPWFFPSPNSDITVCDPWQAVDFFNFTVNDIPDDQCSGCLSDCRITMYDTSITTIPFRWCDSSNLGVSPLCQMDNPKLPKPTKFANEVLEEYANSVETPTFNLGTIQTSTRRRNRSFAKDVFENLNSEYDAYNNDIAMVQIYFAKSTAIQMATQPSQTWVTYFSNVGGLLGLVLGMGIVSFIELIWLCCRLGAKKLHLTHIVP